MDRDVVGDEAVELGSVAEDTVLEQARLNLNAAPSPDGSDETEDAGKPISSEDGDDSDTVPEIDRPKPSDWQKFRGKYQSKADEVKKLREEVERLRGGSQQYPAQSAQVQSEVAQQHQVRQSPEQAPEVSQASPLTMSEKELEDGLRACGSGEYGDDTVKKARLLEAELLKHPAAVARRILSKAKNGEYGKASSPIAVTVREMLPEIMDRDLQSRAEQEHVREYNAAVDRSLKSVMAKAPEIQDANSVISQYCRAAYQELASINPSFMASRPDFPEVVYTHARRMMAEAKLTAPAQQQQQPKASMSSKSIETGGRAPTAKRETTLERARRELEEAVPS